MVDYKELRIGNKLIFKGVVWDVTYIPDDDNYYEEFEPIPLTEEWLKRFGFNFHSLSNQYGVNIESWIILGNRFGYLEVWYLTNNPKIVKFISGNNNYTDLKYVHQLQNLYFALTSQELTLK